MTKTNEDYRAKTFQELEAVLRRVSGIMTAREFAEWLDEHGYKTFPDMPDYVS